MTDRSTLEDTTLTERLVLLSLVELTDGERTPVGTLDLLQRCRERKALLDEAVCGRFTEADLASACRRLVAAGLAAEHEPATTSPVGKGRTTYELTVDAGDVREIVTADDRFAWQQGESNSS